MDKRIKRGIFYDRYLRACLVDHFIEKGLPEADFSDCNYTDLGDFADGTYLVTIKDGKVILERNGEVLRTKVFIKKEIAIRSDREIEISYTIRNNSSVMLDTCFGTEFNVTMPGDEPGAGLSFSVEPEKIWKISVETVSQSERSYGLNFQSRCIFPIWAIKLDGAEESSFTITWRLT